MGSPSAWMAAVKWLSREPVYGLREWAQRHAPDLIEIPSAKMKHLNDDRLGRCLDRLFGGIDRRGCRFITVLPRTRREDKQLRQRPLDETDPIIWTDLYQVVNDDGQIVDHLHVASESSRTSDGFRLLRLALFASRNKARQLGFVT